MDFKIGFWNYVETGILDPKKAVKDWKELGMTLPMSFAYDPKKHKKEDMIALLDECHKEGMKVIVCDIRASYRTLYLFSWQVQFLLFHFDKCHHLLGF